MANNSMDTGGKTRGLGFQINAVVCVGVLLMVTILMSFIGYRSFETMMADGTREKYNELGMRMAPIQERYSTVYQSAKSLAARVEQIMALPPEARSRADLVTALEATIAANPNIVGTGACFEPNAFDGQDAAFANTPLSDATGRAIPYAAKDPSGRIVVSPLTGYETDDWYQSPRTTQKITLSEPYWYNATPTTKYYMLTVSVPIIENGRFIGAVTVDFDIAPFQSDLAKVSSPDNFFVVFSPKGTVIAHGVKPDNASRSIYELVSKTESEGQKFFGKELYTFEKVSESTGEMSTYIFQPIVFDGVEQPWGALIVVSNNLFTSAAKELVIFSIVIAVLCSLALLVALAFFVQKRVSKPLEGLAGMIERFAALDMRAEQNAHLAPYLDRNDEVGSMTRACGAMAKSLRGIVGQINGSSQSVAAASEQLTATAQNTAHTAREITSAIHSIADGATTQAQDTNEAAAHLDHVQELLDDIQKILRQVNDVSHAIRDRKDEGADILSNAMKKSEETAHATNDVATVVEETNRSAEKIESASEMIQSIADQTNLLALNAAIEAARAGEAGRGFAVVAEEIRKLAEQSNSFTEEIRSVISELKNKAQRAVDTMDVSKGLVTETQAGLDETQEKFQKIDEAVTEALKVIERMNTSTEDIVKASQEVARVVQGLQRLAQENAATSQQGNAAVETQTVSLEDIANASEGLANIATDLQGEVGKFKV